MSHYSAFFSVRGTDANVLNRYERKGNRQQCETNVIRNIVFFSNFVSHYSLHSRQWKLGSMKSEILTVEVIFSVISVIIVGPEVGSTAFYAYLSNVIRGITPGQIIAFDGIFTNIGNAYHSNGTFLAPTVGRYWFYWHFHLTDSAELDASLR